MGTISEKLVYLNGTKQAIKQAINEDFEVIDNNTTFREYADEISSNNTKYKDLIPKETKNATNTLDISNSAGLDKALVTQYGNTYQEGEPTPDAPQEIVNISGKSTLKDVGKNLIGLGTQLNGYVDQSTLKFQTNPGSIGYYFETSKLPNTITISAVNSNRANVCYFSVIPAYQSVCALRSASNDNPRTITVDKTYPYIHIQLSYNFENVTNIQIESGSNATEYEPYQSQTYPISLDYTNLFKKQDISSDDLNRRLNQIGEYYDEIGYFISPFIKVDEDTKYTINYTPTAYTRICYYASNNTNSFISRNDNISSFTTPSTCQYLKFCNLIADIDNIRLEKGSTITNNYIELCKIGNYKDRIYPLNGKWYLEKKIGKVIIDENIVGGALTDSNQRIMFSSSSNPFISNVYIPTPSSVSNLTPSLSNYFSSSAQSEITPTNNKVGFSKWGDNTFVYFSAIYNSVKEFKNWLSTHNTIVYYALATPTTTEITESNYPTLYNQLNNIKLFEGVNHITMTNESGLDVEFDITYYKDWKLD